MALSFGYDIGTADSSFIYGQKELKHLDKQYLRSINPEKHMKNIDWYTKSYVVLTDIKYIKRINSYSSVLITD